jgi:hypothetical protein
LEIKFVARIKRRQIFIYCTWVWRNIVEDYSLLEYDAVSIIEGVGEDYYAHIMKVEYFQHLKMEGNQHII